MIGCAPPALPIGFTALLDRRVRVLDGRLGPGPPAGAVLLGGSPAVILRLSAAACPLVCDGRVVVRDRAGAVLARRLLDAGLANPVPPPEARRAPLPVSVVVPVRDNPAGLDRLLAALRATSAPAEVLVVDDGSADPAALAAVTGRHGARLWRHPHSLGPAAARNTGLAAATTPLVAFCDSDVVPGAPGWLDELAAQFADPALALAAPRIVALDQDGGRSWIDEYERARSALDLGPDPGPVRPVSAVAYVPSAAMVVRVAAVGAGFDPGFRVAEDVDLVLRLHRDGWRMRYLPEVTVAHQHRTRLRQWLARKAYYGTGAAPLAARHRGQVPPVRLSPWTALACGLLVAQRRWSVPAAGAVSAIALLRLSRSLRGLPRHRRLAARLAATGLGGAAWQCASALVRHWWPVTVPACLVSKRARRAVLAAAITEGVADWWWRGGEAPLPGYLIAHRLDDLAYGAGLWRGALRQRTVAPLLPQVVRGVRPGGRADRPRGGSSRPERSTDRVREPAPVQVDS